MILKIVFGRMKVFGSSIQWMAALILSLCTVFIQAEDKAQQWRVYIGGYNTPDNFGINYFDYDSNIASLTPKGLAIATDNPSYLISNRDGTRIYCVNETASFEGSGTVSTFEIITEDGTLNEISKYSTEGTYPCHLSLNKKEDRLITANYGSGSIIMFPVSKRDGDLGPRIAFFQFSGSGPDVNRQASSHAHCVAFNPQQTHLYCCDLGADRVMTYSFSRKGIPLTAAMEPYIEATAGAGPRHMVFHPRNPFLYVLNELNNTITLYEAEYDTFFFFLIKKKSNHKDGKLTQIDTWSLLPNDFIGANTAAAIKIHPNGKFLYASNRGHDSIAVFAINDKTGKLNPVDFFPTGGRFPRDFAIHPDGKSLVIANEGSNNLTTFFIDPETGVLTPSGQDPVKSERPSCVLFVPVKKK